MPIKKIIKYLFSNSISNGVNFFSRWFLNYSLARLMPLEGFGVYSFIRALANVFKGVISYGGQLYLIYKVSKEKENKYFFFFKSNLLSFVITIGLVLVLFLVNILDFTALNEKHFLYAILLASILAIIQNIYSFFKGLGFFNKEAVGYIILLLLIALFISALHFNLIHRNLRTVLVAVLFIHFVLFGFSAWQFFKYLKKEKISEDLFKNIRTGFGKFIRERTSYGLHELQSVLYINATILVLGFVVKEKDLAVYKSLQIVIVPLSILPMIFSQVLLKQLSEHIKNNKTVNKTFRVFLFTTGIIGLILFLFIVYFGEDVIHLFYGNKLLNISYIGEIIVLLTMAYFFRFISANYGVLITAKDKQKIRVYATAVLILITVFGTIFLTKHMGIVGAAYANAISYFTLMIIYLIYSEFKLL